MILAKREAGTCPLRRTAPCKPTVSARPQSPATLRALTSVFRRAQYRKNRRHEGNREEECVIAFPAFALWCILNVVNRSKLVRRQGIG